MNILKFNTKKEFEKYLENDSLILIDSNCIYHLNNDFSQKFMQYCASNNTMHIFLKNNEKLSFKSNNNIISLSNVIGIKLKIIC